MRLALHQKTQDDPLGRQPHPQGTGDSVKASHVRNPEDGRADLPGDRRVHQPQEDTADIPENRLERAAKGKKRHNQDVQTREIQANRAQPAVGDGHHVHPLRQDGWCYCFNVLDVFTRKWTAYMFDTTATADTAIQSVLQAVSEAGGKVPGLRLRTDNGPQYISRKFREAMQALGIRQEFIWKHTPEQNGHIESFHGTLKREYVWPHEFARFQDAEVVLARAFADYNDDRIHSALGYVTPNEFAREAEDGNK